MVILVDFRKAFDLVDHIIEESYCRLPILICAMPHCLRIFKVSQWFVFAPLLKLDYDFDTRIERFSSILITSDFLFRTLLNWMYRYIFVPATVCWLCLNPNFLIFFSLNCSGVPGMLEALTPVWRLYKKLSMYVYGESRSSQHRVWWCFHVHFQLRHVSRVLIIILGNATTIVVSSHPILRERQVMVSS